MIYNCPNCMAALIYNPQYGKLHCLSCNSTFETNAFEEKEKNEETIANRETDELKKAGIIDELMECNIYTCTACNAELAVNGVEASTFCAYCGQPTIVYSRVSQEQMPKYILPFRITREQALEVMRQALLADVFLTSTLSFN